MKYLFSSFIIIFSIYRVFSQHGQLDLTFNRSGKAIFPIDNQSLEANSIITQTDGKILISGIATSTKTKRDYFVIRCKNNGELDESFNQNGKLIIDFYGKDDFCYDLAQQPDGKILMTGIVSLPNFERKAGIVRLNTNGTLDSTFGTNGISISSFIHKGEDSRAILVQKDGKIIISGSISFSTPSFTTECALFRYNSDGTIDQSFGTSGIATAKVPNGYYPSFAIQQFDNKIISGGYLLGNNTDVYMLRFNSDGTLDNSFGINGKVQTDFNSEDEYAYKIALQSDNKILIVAGIRNATGSDFGILRYNTDGSLDNTFGFNGKVVTDFSLFNNVSNSIAIQEDQKIVIAGFVGDSPNHNFALARYNASGSLDLSFGNNGKVVTDFGGDDAGFDITLQKDNKILVAGNSINSSKVGEIATSRYMSGLEIVNTIETKVQLNDVHFYPNPSKNRAILEYCLTKDQILNISLFDLGGIKIQSFVDSNVRQLGMNKEVILFDKNIKPGNYILVIDSQELRFGIEVNLNPN
ncbi:MAG: hypothetical protein IPK88_16785 [Saprospiraceae bacterium]|nr:hypothetical protein [Candidatus Defluviibacterium haderslevense]